VSNLNDVASARPETSGNDGSLTGGSTDAKRYYDQEGWKLLPDGRTVDLARWGVREDGPLRIAAHRLRMRRIHETFARVGSRLDFLECGGGGEPELSILDLCRHYTGLDFSPPGLQIGAAKLAPTGIPFRMIEGDMCSLPFPDESFDAAYSAQAIYHIPDVANQARALREICRVTRRAGVVVLVLANARPLLFPGRLMRRLVADTPGLSHVANTLRTPPPIPFNPRPLGWMRRLLQEFGRVDIRGYMMASVWVNHHVTERHGIGRVAWQTMGWLEREHPRLAARLGISVTITVAR